MTCSSTLEACRDTDQSRLSVQKVKGRKRVDVQLNITDGQQAQQTPGSAKKKGKRKSTGMPGQQAGQADYSPST